MKRWAITFSLLLFCGLAFCQSTNIPQNIRTNEVVDRLSSANGLGPTEQLYGIPLPEGRVVGDTYLDTTWKAAAILLYEKDKLVEGYQIRYDIKLNEFEIKANGTLKVLPGNRIKSFTWLNTQTELPEYFLNARAYYFNEIPMDGFVQVLNDGDVQLIKKFEIVVREADYKPQFDVGSRDTKVYKKPKYFLVKNQNATVFPSSNKKLLFYFSDEKDKLKEFLEVNNLNLKNEWHMVKVVDQYNSLKNIKNP